MHTATRALSLLCAAAFTLLASAASAQHAAPGGDAAPSTTPPAEAHQLDFLLGEWTLVAKPHVSTMVALFHGQPELTGSWKAWRSVEGFGLEDEMRLQGPSGDPLSFSHALRIFDRASGRWLATSVDVYRTRMQTSRGTWSGNALTSEAEVQGDDGRTVLVRTRFDSITADGFRWQQQRSYDAGATWEEPSLVIEAHRARAARR
jgi:hypothetical protein